MRPQKRKEGYQRYIAARQAARAGLGGGVGDKSLPTHKDSPRSFTGSGDSGSISAIGGGGGGTQQAVGSAPDPAGWHSCWGLFSCCGQVRPHAVRLARYLPPSLLGMRAACSPVSTLCHGWPPILPQRPATSSPAICSIFYAWPPVLPLTHEAGTQSCHLHTCLPMQDAQPQSAARRRSRLASVRHAAEDEAYASYLAHIVDLCLGVFLFFGYILAAILIFTLQQVGGWVVGCGQALLEL